LKPFGPSNTLPGSVTLSDYPAAIDEIEKRSGLDMLREVLDELEGKIEGSLNATRAEKHLR